MLALEVLGGVVVLLALTFVLSRDVPLLEDEPEDAKDSGLPTGRLLRSDDIPRLRFRVGIRGYRMSDVDAALDAVRRTLEAAEGTGEEADAAPEPPMESVPPRTTPDDNT
jgi:DivIVA domain-containing protein